MVAAAQDQRDVDHALRRAVVDLRQRVAESGYGEEAVHAELWHAVLAKPFTAAALAAAISEVVGS